VRPHRLGVDKQRLGHPLRRPAVIQQEQRVQLDEGELAGGVDGHEQKELALGGLNFGDVDVEEANGISLGLGLGLLVALDLRQTRDAVALEAAMQA
jgi:hypothetical protein